MGKQIMLNGEYLRGSLSDVEEFVVVHLPDGVFGTVHAWMGAAGSKTSTETDMRLARAAKVALQQLFDELELVIQACPAGEVNLETIRFKMGSHQGGMAIAIPSDYFSNPSPQLQRLKPEELDL
ncbi:hypothetical protein [Burkholderia cepacia]|uniref:hypothetical protein n=1 Tax=Burkholderia cepacia TaxID=292 RepID=UPI001CF1A627|nr:hypothetical protein [Burkholderia cepacia]MCA8354880.1 hypothetical protein [Burkholderia cepacia]